MTGVVPLGHAGTFALRVSGVTEGRDVTEAGGPYRIETFRISSGPESRSATVVVGDTVRGERIDHPGDVDTFLLTAPEGREIIVTLHGTRDSVGHAFELRVLNPANGLSLGETASVGAPQASARISVPPGPPLRLAIAENVTLCGQPPCAEGATLTGSYWFTTHVFDPAPEGRAASFAIGDTLDERIDPIGDVDEYEFTGSAGEQLRLQFATPDGVSTSGGCAQGLTAVVRSKATFQALRVANSQAPGTLDANSLAFTLPSAGAYTLTVSEVQGARCVTGHYLARVARQP
jgi:hypothetical protein